ncbi:hypothetical protein T01_3231 [Trichinella spiralis]|uniref:Uncharacterized protein n=1 Tax=Trichinella spiralis TaxID=6334 RepID=A0A0V1BJ53_TRISP|nr:hypothetical protein T01_3231 [Trichinella spiralis]
MEFTKAASSVNVGNADTVVHLLKENFENRNFLCYLFNSKYSDMSLEGKVDYCYQCTNQRMEQRKSIKEDDILSKETRRQTLLSKRLITLPNVKPKVVEETLETLGRRYEKAYRLQIFSEETIHDEEELNKADDKWTVLDCQVSGFKNNKQQNVKIWNRCA